MPPILDRDVLDVCLNEARAAPVVGQMGRAGQRLGNNSARFSATNRLIGLNMTSPVAAKPWRFYFTYLSAQPMVFPLGTERSLVQLQWRAIPFTMDPYQQGAGSFGTLLYDHQLDD